MAAEYETSLQFALAIGGDNPMNWKLDTFTIPAIEGLRSLGFETLWSCEGHGKEDKAWGSGKFPFIDVHCMSNVDTTQLQRIITLNNLLTLDDSAVTLKTYNSDQYAQIVFGVCYDKSISLKTRLLSAKLDMIRFGYLCRALELGAENFKSYMQICQIEIIRNTKENPREKIRAARKFIEDHLWSLTCSKPNSLSAHFINEGVGL